MQWYILSESTNPDVIGNAFPRLEEMFSAANPYEDYVTRYIYEPLPAKLAVPNYRMLHRAKLTDWMSSNMTNVSMLISEKFLNCLSAFVAPPQKVFSTRIFDKKGDVHSYFLLLQNAMFDIIDYERSIFCTIKGQYLQHDRYVYECDEFKAADFEDHKNRGGAGPISLFMKEDIPFDYFLLATPPFFWMVNEKVAEALRAAHITGICLIPFRQGDDFVNDDLVSKAMRAEGLK